MAFIACSKSRCSGFKARHVRLGFEVDPSVPVHRAEVWERINTEAG